MSPYELFVALAFVFRSWYKTFVLANNGTVGKRVQEAREASGLTRAELAEACGSTEAAVRLWETDQRVPRLKYLAGIAEKTGREISWFFEGVAA